MQKHFLAAVVASLVAGQAMAVTVVDDGTNKFTVGGHIGMRYGYEKGDGVTARGDSSRFNFQFESKLNDDVTAFALGEWGFDVTNHDSNSTFFNNRLGFAGVKSSYGSVSVGQQWSTYSKVALWTDEFATTGGGASGAYGKWGDYNGTARANEALQYNLSIEGLNISAQYQVGGSEKEAADIKRTRKHGYAAAVSYDLPMGLSFGAAYNQTSFVEANQKDAKALAVATKYEQGPFYAAASFSETKNHADFDGQIFERAHGYEVYGSFQFNESFKLGAGFNTLRDQTNKLDNTKLEYYPVELVYTAGPVQLSGTYTFERSLKAGKKVEDSLVAQIRYYF